MKNRQDEPIKVNKKNLITFKKGTKVLIPDGYRNARLPINVSAIINRFALAVLKNAYVLEKAVETSWNRVVVSKIEKNEEVIDFNDKERLIKSLKKSLTPMEDIIEVENGKTVDGYNYIYFIYKNAKPEGLGAYTLSYILTLQLFNENEIIQVKGLFEEINTTGVRESLAMTLAEKFGIITVKESGLEGWFEPFDAERESEVNRNLGERRGFDALVSYNPLSQARELLLSIIEHKYVINIGQILDEYNKDVKNDSVGNSASADDVKNKLFSKDCTRRTRDVIL